MKLRPILQVALLTIATIHTQAHPDKVEDRLLLHLATGAHPPSQGNWEDLTHSFTAKVHGTTLLTNFGPALGFRLNGSTDYLTIETTPDRLPKREISISAWVLLDETQRDGGILGYIQDNGAFEHGFLLGYDNRAFTFSLATQRANGPVHLTQVRAKSAINLGRWHHVTGTYDGTTMRLYVNGTEEAMSADQSGDISYPPKATLAVGTYLDDDEFHPAEGAFYQAKLYARALSADEIAAEFSRNKVLADYEPPINKALQFVVAPYLQFATKSSITIMCETSVAARMHVEFGERYPLTLQAESNYTNQIQSVTLRNLKPQTVYFYRVTSVDNEGNIARSHVFTFQTAPEENSAWAFGILGDTQRNPEVTRKCADGIFALRPNLMIHLGDVVDDGFAKHQWVSELFEPASKLFAHVPAFPVIGNHEKNSHWYYDYFHLPAPEYFYTFKFANAQYFMIDSNKDLSRGSEQYKWLEQELKNSKAAWKFAAHHHPAFSSDEDDYGDKLKGKAPKGYSWGDNNAKHLVELYEKYGVDIVFAGHIHSYERTWPILNMSINQKNGVRYIVSGGGGGGLEQAAPQRSWFTLHVQRGHHFCFATVQDRTIQFKAYDIEGRLFDTFELSKNGE